MVEIPSWLQTPERRFILLGSHGEDLKRAFEKDWQENANYQFDDPKLSAHKGNFGVCGGFGDLHIIDCDDLERWTELDIIPLIPETFTIESRPGHRQYYLLCKEPFHSGGLYDPEKTEINEAGKPEYVHIGDVKAGSKDGICGGYVVGPGCKHPSGSIYQVVVDAPIAEVSREHLRSIITRLKTSKKVNTNYQKAEEQVKAARQRHYEEKDPLDVLQVVDIMPPDGNVRRSGDELRGDHPVHGSTNGGNYVINTAKNLWHCKRCESGGGAAAAIAVRHGLISCSDAAPGELRGDLFKEVLKIAKEKYGMAGNGNSTGPKVAPSDILERIKADPRALKDPVTLAALAALKANDPVEYDLFLESIKKCGTGIKIATITDLVDKCIQKSEKATVEISDTPSDIADAAKLIIDSGEAYEYIHKTWQKRVKGNGYLGKALLVSRGVQSCLNTKGVHVYAHGKHGHGKSEGMERMIELVPSEFRMDEDVSPLAIHYASMNGMLLPGTTLLIDEMVWSDSLGGIIKRVITRFQKGAGHLTVIDGESVLVRTQPRLAIWTNSADLQADEQLRDRFLDEPITEGKDHVKNIIEFQKLRDTLPESSEEVDRETAICQAILRDLVGKTFTVKIPFAKRINILASEGTRGYNIFSDLVKGLAAMRYAQRTTNEQGQLLATEADFKDAKDIYEGSKGHSEESYTTAETKVLQAIIDRGYKALYKDIKNLTGMSEGRIKDIVNGRGKDEQKRHGLRYKCPQLDVNTVDISVVIAGTYSDRITTHPVELSLPSSFKVDDKVRQNLVTLDPDVERRGPDADPDVPIIDINRYSDVEDVVKEERREEDTSKLQTSSVKESIPSSQVKTAKCYVTATPSSLIAESTTSPPAIPCVNHVCAKCGEDLTGHGTIERAGKAYCARPGCGYPARGEAGT
jgi:Bifunctional DNA primase/polymerase, N-terminal